MGEAVKIDGYGLQGRLEGSLRVIQQPGRDMRGTGTLEVAGRYRAYGQNLQITRGTLLWANAEIGNPRLIVRAEREVGSVTAGIKVDGYASAPQVAVYSDPAMSESEALSYLTLGRPLSNLTGAEAQQLSASKAALNAGTGLLAAELGARIGLDDAGVTDSRALGSDVLTVGKYLSPKLYVGYGVSLLGTGQVVMLKYLLRKGFGTRSSRARWRTAPRGTGARRSSDAAVVAASAPPSIRRGWLRCGAKACSPARCCMGRPAATASTRNSTDSGRSRTRSTRSTPISPSCWRRRQRAATTSIAASSAASSACRRSRWSAASSITNARTCFAKLAVRNPLLHERWRTAAFDVHPLFEAVAGGIAAREPDPFDPLRHVTCT